MALEKQIPDVLGKSLLHALKETAVVLEKGYLAPSQGVEQVATQGARLALSLIQSAIRDAESSQHAAVQGSAPILGGDCMFTGITLMKITLTVDPLFVVTSSETQVSTVVEASGGTSMKDNPTTESLLATPELHITIPGVHITPPSIDSSWDEEQSEATTPRLESLLDIVDPGPFILPSFLLDYRIPNICTEFAFMDEEEPLPINQADDDVPLPDPEMLRWRTGATTSEQNHRRSSNGITATGQHILRLRAASKWKGVACGAHTDGTPFFVGRLTIPVRKPPPQALPPRPPQPPGSHGEIEMDIVEQSRPPSNSEEHIV